MSDIDTKQTVREMSAIIFSRHHTLTRTNSTLHFRDPKRLSNRLEKDPPSPVVKHRYNNVENVVTEALESYDCVDLYYLKHAPPNFDVQSNTSKIIGTFQFIEDTDDNVQYNASTNDDLPTIKSATIEKLLEKIVDKKLEQDGTDIIFQELYDIFFATYTSFVSPDELLTLFISLYCPSGCKTFIQFELIDKENKVQVHVEEKVEDRRKMNENVISCLIFWITNYYYEIPELTICRAILFLKENRTDAKELFDKLERALIKICSMKVGEEFEVALPLAMEWEDYVKMVAKTTEESDEDDDSEQEDAQNDVQEIDVCPIFPKDWDGETFDLLQWSPKELAVSSFYIYRCPPYFYRDNYP